jgi:N4-gp56 family major capsid protein
VTDEWTYAQSVKIVRAGGASNGDEVHGTIIYGQDAYGLVKLGGKGRPNIQIIVKPVGSSGSNDPLNQRGTIAWKVPHFACAIIQDDFIIRIEHGVSD